MLNYSYVIIFYDELAENSKESFVGAFQGDNINVYRVCSKNKYVLDIIGKNF